MSDSENKQAGISRDMVMMVVALTLVTAIAAALLGLTDMVTREPILEAQRAALQRSLGQVLPTHANEPMDDVIRLQPDEDATAFYVARDADGAVLALAWEVVAPDGYSGSIRILMGVLPDGSLHAVRITEHRETPGLGDGITQNRKWIDFFTAKSLAGTHWAVKKDGGEFDQFTGATITPRAVVKAVHRGLGFFATQREALLAKAAGE